MSPPWSHCSRSVPAFSTSVSSRKEGDWDLMLPHVVETCFACSDFHFSAPASSRALSKMSLSQPSEIHCNMSVAELNLVVLLWGNKSPTSSVVQITFSNSCWISHARHQQCVTSHPALRGRYSESGLWRWRGFGWPWGLCGKILLPPGVWMPSIPGGFWMGQSMTWVNWPSAVKSQHLLCHEQHQSEMERESRYTYATPSLSLFGVQCCMHLPGHPHSQASIGW